MTATLLVPAPAVLATDTAGTTTGASETEISEQELALDGATPTELRAIVDDLNSRNDALLADNDALLADNESLHRAVDGLSSERDQLVDSLRHFDDLYEPLEADRQLLFELRKGLPETRPEAEAQLARIRSLALSSNPSRLGQLVDRVGEVAPTFFEWRFTEFASEMEAADAYIESGANAFDSSMNEFRNEVLMSVANRLDGILTVIDRVR